MMARTQYLLPACMAGLLLAAACGGSGQKSPTSPDAPAAAPDSAPAPAPDPAPAPSPSGSATIAGTVSTGASALTSVSTLGLSGVTVSIPGTGIASVTDGTGHFRLDHVPGGTVPLTISGAGVNGELELHDVADHDSIEIDIEASSSGAHIVHDSRDDESGHDAEAHGTASDFTGSCPNRGFRIGSQVVATNGSTRYEDGTCSSLAGSPSVEVKGPRQADGSITATSVEFDHEGADDDQGNDDNEAEDTSVSGSVSALGGTCPSLTFTVAGRAVSTSASTTFEHGACGDVASGKNVEVEGPVSGSAIVARTVSFEDGAEHQGGDGHDN